MDTRWILQIYNLQRTFTTDKPQIQSLSSGKLPMTKDKGSKIICQIQAMVHMIVIYNVDVILVQCGPHTFSKV